MIEYGIFTMKTAIVIIFYGERKCTDIHHKILSFTYRYDSCFWVLETPSDFCYQCCSSLDFHLGPPMINYNKERLGIDLV